MTTNNNNLVDLLSQRMDLDKAEAEEQLQQLVELIRQEVQNNGSYHLDKLGTFQLQNGILDFKADNTLALEINYKYAGMKPIELIGAYKDLPETSVPVADLNGEKQDDPQQTVKESGDIGVDEVPGSQKGKTEEEQPGEVETEPAAIEPESRDEPEPLARKQDVKPEQEEPLEKEVEPQLDQEETKKEDRGTAVTGDKWKPNKKYRQKENPKPPVGKWLIAAVIVISLGLSGWLVYETVWLGNGTGELSATNNEEGVQAVQDNDGRTDSETGEQAADIAGSGVGMNQDERPPVNEEDGDENNPEQQSAKTTSTVTDIAEESRQSVYGLRGGATPEITDGYTIVVHSLRDEAKVRRVNSELQQQGYRTVVFSANVMDTTFWRLGMGQFKTVEDALNAARTLPDIYRENHFIKRIQ